ncbi:hypothetical protein ES703_73014 [subsurface metagenome]
MLLLRETNHNPNMVEQSILITVAIAEPAVSRRGKGPIPKMRKGFMMIFRTFPMAKNISGVRVSPAAESIWLMMTATIIKG